MTSPSTANQPRKRLAYVLIGVGLVLAVVVIGIGIQRYQSSNASGTGRSGDSNSPASRESGQGSTEGAGRAGTTQTAPPSQDSTSPKPAPSLPENWAKPGEPNLTVPSGAPPPGIAGVYMVNFQVRADTCSQGTPGSSHELEIRVDGNSVAVVDRLTKITMTGGSTEAGQLVAIYSVDQEIGKRKDIINATVDGSKIAGKYFVTPPMSTSGCVVEFDMDGSRTR